MIQPGQVLYFGLKGDVTGIVRADGAIQCDGLVGSIHQVGRKLMNAPCNGWEHWFYEDEQGERKPLDTLRQAYLAACTLRGIDAALAAGGKVYLHCLGGIGRTGTVVIEIKR